MSFKQLFSYFSITFLLFLAFRTQDLTGSERTLIKLYYIVSYYTRTVAELLVQ